MKLNRKLVLVLALVLSVAMATTGTLAYLTDRDSKVNEFTMGDVSIDLNEKFEPGTELLPGVAVEKEPTIENTGSTDAWVWMEVAVPENFSGLLTIKEELGSNWQQLSNDPQVKDGKAILTFLYKDALKPGETTSALFKEVELNEWIDIKPDGAMYQVHYGNVEDLHWNINTNGNVKMYVSAYGIQAKNIDSVASAYITYNNQWGEGGGKEWDNPDEKDEVVSTLAELQKAVKEAMSKTGTTTIVLTKDLNGANWESVVGHLEGNIVINGNGHKITGMKQPLFGAIGMSSEGKLNPASHKNSLTIKDLTIADASMTNVPSQYGFGAFIEQIDGILNVTLDNCKLDKSTVGNENADVRTGGLIGWNCGANETYPCRVTVKNCVVQNSKVIAKNSVGGVFGHTNNSNDCEVVIEDTNVINTQLNSKSNEDARVGAIVGTVQLGKTTISDCAFGGNTLSQDAGDERKDVIYGESMCTQAFGRFVHGNTGKLIIDGKTVSSTSTITDKTVISIGTKEELKAIAASDKNYDGETIVLTADIDLGGEEWTPICNNGKTYCGYFGGVFDGNGHTIKNFKIKEYIHENSEQGVGLFGWIGAADDDDDACVKNLTVENVTIEGNHYAGVIAGYLQGGSIENCHVKNSTVTSKHTGELTKEQGSNTCGDKAGGIVGYVQPGATVSNCSVKNSAITAGRDAGQVIGCADPASSVNNTAEKVYVTADTADGKCTGKNIRNEIIGRPN